MNNQPTAKASLPGYTFKVPAILILFIVAAFLQACTKHDAVSFPEVIRTTPSPGQANIDLEASVSFLFDRSMDSASVSKSFEIVSANGPVPGVLEFRDTLFEFIPERELLPNTEYTVRIEKSARDKRGNEMEADYIFHFTAKGPDQYEMTKTSDHVTDFERDGNRIMQIGQYIYSFGGWSSSPEESYSDIYRSNDLVNWEKRPDAPWHGRHVFGLAKLNDAVYVIGGDNLHNEFDVWRTYDGENWTKLADNILGNRIFFGCTSHNGFIYVVGGSGMSDVWRSKDGMNWTKIANEVNFLNGENFAGSLASFNGKLWMICGGGTGFGSGTPSKSVWTSGDGVTWTQEKDFSGTERYYTDVCVWDNKIWVIGGYNYEERNIRSIWYMTQKGVWNELTTPNEFIGRHATAVGVFNNKLVIANGNYNNDCWKIEKIQ